MMNLSSLSLKSPAACRILLGLFLCVYLVSGLYTEIQFMEIKPLPKVLLQDFNIYTHALSRAVKGNDPYFRGKVISGFFYPPPALLIVSIFSQIRPLFLRAAVYWVVNTVLLVLMILGIARYYRYSIEPIWYWFVLCLGFAPLLEMLHIGQINMISLFGIFLLFYWEEKAPALSGVGWAVAIVTKVTPLIFVVYLLVRRRSRVILAAAGTLALLTCFAIVAFGLGPFRTFPQIFLGLLSQVPVDTNSQSLVAKLAFANAPWFQALLSQLPPAIQLPAKALSEALAVHHAAVQRILVFYVVGAIVGAGLCTFYAKLPGEPLFIVTMFGMTLAPSTLWYHHYVFLLLPMLVWMGWSRLATPVVLWCLMGFLIVQSDRFSPPYGLFIHLFGHLSLMALLAWQVDQLWRRRGVRGLGRPLQSKELQT